MKIFNIDEGISNVYTFDSQTRYRVEISTLPNVKKSKKKKKKDSQLVIRIGGKEREVFVSLCDELDTSAAREIRRFIRDFVHEHKK